MRDSYDISNIVKLNAEADELMAKALLDATSAICMLALSVAFPEGAIISKGSKLALDAAQAVCGSAAKYLLESNAIKTEIQAANYKAQMDWFGGSCIYTNESGSDSEKDIMLNIGISDPAVLRAMYQWQYSGIETITGWDDKDIKELIKYTEDKTSENSPEQTLCLKILKNEYNLFDNSYVKEETKLDEEGNQVTEKVRVQVEFVDFMKALRIIQESSSVNVHDSFNHVVEEN